MSYATLIDGQALANEILQEIKEKAALKTRPVGLATVLVGDDKASKVYVAKKRKTAQALGFLSVHHELSAQTSEDEILKLIYSLNQDHSIDAILVQLPLPKHIEQNRILEALDPNKDVDGFHPMNLGYLMMGSPKTVACTPLGIVHMIKSTQIELAGANVVIVGRSTIVGKPLFHLLLQENSTLTLCHSQTKNLASICSKADILVAAVGKAGLINADFVKKDALVIDVGINRGLDGALYGDVDFKSVAEKARFISPVPGGVGPLTIAMLMKNALSLSTR